VISAGDGNLIGFAPLARNLSAEQPLYGLQPSGLDGRHPLDRGIGEMAGRYLARIREVQPHGPYLLAGRCNGVVVAYEMAQRLRAAGEEVPLLISIDSDPPATGPAELRPGIGYDQTMELALVRARGTAEPAPEPDTPKGAAAFADWLREPVGPGVSRYLHEFWRCREDLRRAWPDPLGADAVWLSAWAWDHGRHYDLATGLLLPVETPGCRARGGPAWDWAMACAWEQLDREPADPLSEAGWRDFRRRLLEPDDGTVVNRYLLAAWERPDLRAAFRRPLDGDARLLIEWAWLHGTREGLAPSLLPAPGVRLPRRLRADIAGRRAAGALGRAWASAARGLRDAAVETRARALEAIEGRLDRPLPGARERIARRAVAAAREARASYRGEKWPGRVALIVSAECAEKPTYLAWEERAIDGVERREVAFGHLEMLGGVGAQALAEAVEDVISGALRRRA
jgi:hypothetical protein